MSLIAAVEGIVAGRGEDHVLIVVGGSITLRVYVPARDLSALGAVGDPVRLHTHLVVREDALQLYGFPLDRGRQLFESLLEVNSVGPRVALAVLSVLSPADAARAIAGGDVAALTRAQGVGKRTAERIVLELKGKVEADVAGTATVTTAGAPAADPLRWLQGLGFSELEARQALAAAGDDSLSVDERVRRALRLLGTGAPGPDAAGPAWPARPGGPAGSASRTGERSSAVPQGR